MDVLQAIQARHSVRDFVSTPVPRQVVMQILEAATRSPSGGNGQPWEIFVASGAVMERIRSQYRECVLSGGGGPVGPGDPHGPPPPPAFIQERMAQIRDERLRWMGLDPADEASFAVFKEWRARLFGAPIAVIICLDKALTSMLDIGILCQTICLAAQQFGVESLIASAFVSYPEILRRELDIPENLKMVIGVGLGYPNQDNRINTYRSPRRPFEEVVRFK